MNANKVQRKPTQGPKAIRVYANSEQSNKITAAAEHESLSVSKFTLRSALKEAVRILRGKQ